MPLQAALANALEVKKDDIYIVGEKNCPYNCDAYKKGETLSQVYFADEHPYREVDGNGYIVDIVKAIYEPLGHRVIYKAMPQKLAKARFADGRYNILLGAKKTREYIHPNQSIGQVGRVFYANANTNWHYYGYNSLEMVTLGLVTGEKYPALADYIAANKDLKLRIQFAPAGSAFDVNMQELAKGIISVIYEDKYTTDYYRKIMGLEDIVIGAGKAEKPRKLYLAFSAKKPHTKTYAKQFDTGIAELRKGGKLAEILEKYGVEDWQK